LFCSVPKVLFTSWAGYFFLVLCTAHLPRMCNLVPTLAHPPPPTRSAAAGHTDAGGKPPLPMATAGRTNTGGNTRAPLSAQHARRRFCRRRRRSSNKFTTRLAEWLPPSVQAPPATHLRPSPLDAPPAGLANSGGGPAAAGHINTGGKTTAPLSTRHARHRSCQRRRRRRSTCTPPFTAVPANTRSRPRQYRRRRRHTSAPLGATRPPPVLPTLAAAQKHVHASLARRLRQHGEPPPAIPKPAATRLARSPPPAISTPAATHQRPSPPDTSAAGPANAGSVAEARAHYRCPPPLPTLIAAADHSEAGGSPPRPNVPGGRTNDGGETPAPLPSRHIHRRSCQCRRRCKSTCPSSLPCRRPYKDRRRHTSAPLRPKRPPPVSPMPAAEQ